MTKLMLTVLKANKDQKLRPDSTDSADAKKPRIRRSPEKSKAHILASAKRVFAEIGPDAAGLREVAQEASVSHGLVTHYFGTYLELVEAALEDTATTAHKRILAKLATANVGGLDDALEVFFQTMSEREHGRLVAWALLSGRAEKADFFSRRLQLPRRVADMIESRLASLFPDCTINREEIDRVIVLVMTMGFAFSLGNDVVWAALGHENSDDERVAYQRWLADLVKSRLPVVLGTSDIDSLLSALGGVGGSGGAGGSSGAGGSGRVS